MLWSYLRKINQVLLRSLRVFDELVAEELPEEPEKREPNRRLPF
jgi:hypothetical protein